MHEVRWGAFIPAVILAPFIPIVPALAVLALMSTFDAFNVFGMLALIVTYAAFIGAPTYLTFGGVAAWYALTRHGPNAPFWLFGILANLASSVVILPVMLLAEQEVLSAVAFIASGCIFAPSWGTIGGWLYRRFTKIGDGLQERAAAHSAATTRDIKHPHD